MKKRLFSALCAFSVALSLTGTALASTYSVTLTTEEAAGEIPVLLTIPAVTPAAPGQEADRIVINAPIAGAAVEIPINGKASDTDLLLVDEQGLYEAAEDAVRGESTVSTMLPGTQATLLILKKPPFTDVSRTAWYYGGVVYAYQNQLMSGVSSTKFSPNSAADRAMLVTILHRTAGKPAADGGASFADVPKGKYYSDAVAWAAGAGIVTGSGSGNFNPTGKLTREQLAVILYRYAQYEGRDVSRRADLGAYKDGAKVSSWAKDAMSWAVAEGLITGSNQKNLGPGGSANRAQLATILMRLLESGDILNQPEEAPSAGIRF